MGLYWKAGRIGDLDCDRPQVEVLGDLEVCLALYAGTGDGL